MKLLCPALASIAVSAVLSANDPIPQVADHVAAVYAELGLPAPPKDHWTLPADYLPDAGSIKDVEKTPKKFPVRAAVLEGFKALKESRDLVPAVTIVRKDDLDKSGALKRLSALQERPAIAILTLEEALSSLDKAMAVRKDEPSKRWQAHLDFIRAEVQFRLVVSHEYNLMLGHARIQDLPDLNAEKNETAWRLVPAERIRSRRDVKDLAKAASAGYFSVLEKYPRTPWSKLAEVAREAPMGLQWVPMVDAADQ